MDKGECTKLLYCPQRSINFAVLQCWRAFSPFYTLQLFLKVRNFVCIYRVHSFNFFRNMHISLWNFGAMAARTSQASSWETWFNPPSYGFLNEKSAEVKNFEIVVGWTEGTFDIELNEVDAKKYFRRLFTIFYRGRFSLGLTVYSFSILKKLNVIIIILMFDHYYFRASYFFLKIHTRF